jgi:hypothetical protein
VRQRSVKKPEQIGNNLIAAGKINLGCWSEASKAAAQDANNDRLKTSIG